MDGGSPPFLKTIKLL